LFQVEGMKNSKIDVAREGNDMIVELVQILIAAGSRMDDPIRREPLDHLLKIVCLAEFRNGSEFIMRGHAHRFELISKLVELLLSNGASLRSYGDWTKIRSYADCTKIFLAASVNASHLNSNIEFYIELSGLTGAYHSRPFTWLDAHNSIIDSLGNVLRCVFLSCMGISDPNTAWVQVGRLGGRHFTQLFLYISDYTYVPNRSARLMRDVLNTMNTNLWKLVRKDLYTILENKALRNQKKTESLDCHESARNALKWIEQVEAPSSLQHLARMSVIRAMSGRSLRCASTLGLPTCILDYVLLKID